MRIQITDNPQLVAEIRDKLKENDGYCPCKVIKTDDTKCICKQFLESPEGTTCHCGLYKKTEE